MWIAIAALFACVAIGYAAGSKAVADAMFNAWCVGTAIPANYAMVRIGRDPSDPRTIQRIVMWSAFMVSAVLLATMFFGNPCPRMHIPYFGLPGLG